MQLAQSTEVLVLPSPTDKLQASGPAASASARKSRASSRSTAARLDTVPEDGGDNSWGDEDEDSGSSGSSASEDGDEEASKGQPPTATKAAGAAGAAAAAAAACGPEPSAPCKSSGGISKARLHGRGQGAAAAAASRAGSAPITQGLKCSGAAVHPALPAATPAATAAVPVSRSDQTGASPVLAIVPKHPADARAACPLQHPAAPPVQVQPTLSTSTQPLCPSLMEAAAAAAAGADAEDEAQSGGPAGRCVSVLDAPHPAASCTERSSQGAVSSVHMGEEADVLMTQLMMEAIDAGTEGECTAATQMGSAQMGIVLKTEEGVSVGAEVAPRLQCLLPQAAAPCLALRFRGASRADTSWGSLRPQPRQVQDAP